MSATYLQVKNHEFVPLVDFERYIEYDEEDEGTVVYEYDPMDYVEDVWHHATLMKNGLSPSDDNRYNDFDYEIVEIFDIIKTYGVKPGYYPVFWDYVDELASKSGIDYRNDDGELLRLCIEKSV